VQRSSWANVERRLELRVADRPEPFQGAALAL